MKTLITGGKSAQALKLLKAFTGDQVILADYGEAPSFSSAQYQFISLGEKNEETIAHNLLTACLDQGTDRLIPLHIFELEAVVRSLILFEEFNIHVLLPDINSFPLYKLSGAVNTQNWAVFDKGELLYASAGTVLTGTAEGLNGVFYMDGAGDDARPVLFTVS